MYLHDTHVSISDSCPQDAGAVVAAPKTPPKARPPPPPPPPMDVQQTVVWYDNKKERIDNQILLTRG